MNDTLPANHPYLSEISTYANKLLAKYKPVDPPLRNLVAVGSFCDHDGIEGIAPRDNLWLRSAIEACRDLRLGLAPNFTLRQPNLDTNQVDYLDPSAKIPTDILMTCLVPDEAIVKEIMATSAYKEEYKDAEQHPLFNISPHSGPGAWLYAANRNEARMIICFRDDIEVNAEHFKSPNHVHWNTTPIKTRLITSRDEGREIKTFYRDIILRRDLYRDVKHRQQLAL